jgi:hypothetical protein
VDRGTGWSHLKWLSYVVYYRCIRPSNNLATFVLDLHTSLQPWYAFFFNLKKTPPFTIA